MYMTFIIQSIILSTINKHRKFFYNKVGFSEIFKLWVLIVCLMIRCSVTTCSTRSSRDANIILLYMTRMSEFISVRTAWSIINLTIFSTIDGFNAQHVNLARISSSKLTLGKCAWSHGRA